MLVDLAKVLHFEDLLKEPGVCLSSDVHVDAEGVVTQVDAIRSQTSPLQHLERWVVLVIELRISNVYDLRTEYWQNLLWRHAVDHELLIHHFVNGVKRVHHQRYAYHLTLEDSKSIHDQVLNVL